MTPELKAHPDLSQRLRSIPSISRLLSDTRAEPLIKEFGQALVAWSLREVLAITRKEILSGAKESAPSPEDVVGIAHSELLRISAPVGRSVINATGIILHTGLGRSPLCDAAIEAIKEMNRYSVLEVDLETGDRSKREHRVETLLRELTGCEAATVVNNNAAATLLILKTLSAGKEAIISRGQLIEIGGSFRMPDIMEQSGAILREVGTTNRTYISDYEKAIGPNTGALIRVHPSNYRIHGFTHEPSIEELVALGRKHSIAVVDDVGSGALVRLSTFGLMDSGFVADSLTAGVDAVCFSGDKLISGPQAGIICGTKEAVAKMRAHPYFRMLRVDKLCLAALEATLLEFLKGNPQGGSIPVMSMLAEEKASLEVRARKMVDLLAPVPDITVSSCDDHAYCGGGSSPDEAIPDVSVKVTLAPACKPDVIAKSLRLGLPSIFCRVKEGSLFFNMRTVRADEIELLVSGIRSALN